MKKIIYGFLAAVALVSTLQAENLTLQIPVIGLESNKWEKVSDVAQWGDGDWSQVVGRAEHISLQEAMEIAETHPDITYFFYMKGYQMVLGNYPGDIRVFRQGDAVFFAGQPHWGEAIGYADGYMKKYTIQK